MTLTWQWEVPSIKTTGQGWITTHYTVSGAFSPGNKNPTKEGEKKEKKNTGRWKALSGT